MGTFLLLLGWRVLSIYFIFTARKRSLGQGNIFTPVCHSVHGGGHAWLWGCVCGFWGVCMVARGRECMVARGRACMVVGGGMSGCLGGCIVAGGHVWLAGGHAWLQGCMVVGGACVGYDEIRSMSGRYASYWNAFLLEQILIRYLLAGKNGYGS